MNQTSPDAPPATDITVISVARLGTAIRDVRNSLGLTQAELANRAGVSRQWIVALEKGSPRAEIGRILEVIQALDLGLHLGSPAPQPSVSFTDLDLP